jgi:outer membrane protein OmpA-like peptidoglycan-associated protein
MKRAMVGSSKFAVCATFALGALACGGGQQQAQEPPPPVVQQAPPCSESWVHMPMLITFPTSGSNLDMQNREILRELVRSAQARSDIRRVRVEGHTDTCGNELNNQQLSQNRAMSVANELVMMGVPREMISTIGYGSQQPRANESCGRGQQLSEQTNRRVEFSLLVCR